MKQCTFKLTYCCIRHICVVQISLIISVVTHSCVTKLLYILWSREHQGICVRPRWHKIRPPNVLRMNNLRCANYTLCIYPMQMRIKEIINFVQYDTFNACVYLPSVQSTVCLIEHAALASIVHKLKPKRYREDLRGPARATRKFVKCSISFNRTPRKNSF